MFLWIKLGAISLALSTVLTAVMFLPMLLLSN